MPFSVFFFLLFLLFLYFIEFNVATEVYSDKFFYSMFNEYEKSWNNTDTALLMATHLTSTGFPLFSALHLFLFFLVLFVFLTSNKFANNVQEQKIILFWNILFKYNEFNLLNAYAVKRHTKVSFYRFTWLLPNFYIFLEARKPSNQRRSTG